MPTPSYTLTAMERAAWEYAASFVDRLTSLRVENTRLVAEVERLRGATHEAVTSLDVLTVAARECVRPDGTVILAKAEVLAAILYPGGDA